MLPNFSHDNRTGTIVQTGHAEHDLFLLMLNLSQLKDPDRIRHLFVEALNSFWPGLGLRMVAKDEVPGAEVIAIATVRRSFGQLAMEGDTAALSGDDLALIHNSIGMLAIILENRLQARLLADDNLRLEMLVQERTAELVQANRELKREVAEHQRAEEQIRQYADIVGNMPIGLYVYHLEDLEDDRTLRLAAANAAASTITGLPMSEVLGKSIDENFPRLRDQGMAQQFADVVRTGQPVQLDSFAYTDARIGPMVFSVKLVPLPGQCVAVLFEDIAERAQMEHALRQARQEWEDTFQAIGHPALILNQAHQVLAANRAALQATGLTEDALKAKKCFEVFHLSDHPPKECPLNTALHSKRGRTTEMEIEALRGNFLVSCTPFMDEQGNLQKVIHIATDITDRKRMEQQLHHLNADLEERVRQRTRELEAANKELTNFAYVVSHDLKAPLRSIHQLASWLAEDYTDVLGDEGQEITALLTGRVRRMDRLIEGILEYSRVGRMTGEWLACDLNTVVKNVIDMLAPPEDIQIQIPEALPVVIGDQIQLEQLFQNLLGNAIKFMRHPPGKVTIGSVEAERHWTLWVSDNGPGIEAQYQEKIFQMFQTLAPRDEHENTGIGLALVKKIITLHGGQVWVESAPGQGSTFWFTLPKQAGIPLEKSTSGKGVTHDEKYETHSLD